MLEVSFDELNVETLRYKIKASFVHTKSFRPVRGGSEATVVDLNLQMCIDEALKITNRTDIIKTVCLFKCGEILAETTKSKPCISIINHGLSSAAIPGGVSEAKGEEVSILMGR